MAASDMGGRKERICSKSSGGSCTREKGRLGLELVIIAIDVYRSVGQTTRSVEGLGGVEQKLTTTASCALKGEFVGEKQYDQVKPRREGELRKTIRQGFHS